MYRFACAPWFVRAAAAAIFLCHSVGSCCCSSNSYIVLLSLSSIVCRLEKEIPNLVDFVQSGLNVRSGTKQAEVEVMLSMVSKLQQGKDWPTIEKECSQLQSDCSSYSKIMAAFVRLQPPETIKDIALFYKVCVYSEGPNRFMGSEWIGKAAALNFGKFEKFPLIIAAAWKANLNAKGSKIRDGNCELLRPSHLQSLTANGIRKNIQQAEKVMADARGVCAAMNLNIADTVRILGHLDTRLVLMLCKLSKQAGEQDFDSFDRIGQAAA